MEGKDCDIMIYSCLDLSGQPARLAPVIRENPLPGEREGSRSNPVSTRLVEPASWRRVATQGKPITTEGWGRGCDIIQGRHDLFLSSQATKLAPGCDRVMMSSEKPVTWGAKVEGEKPTANKSEGAWSHLRMMPSYHRNVSKLLKRCRDCSIIQGTGNYR
uniref:Uncharacterized protein n=1 Tax=Timema bartmani TaxID=61472 RepID=A0A7R9I8B2_9NEOP|nr:unnamed protein product [Timema bartmani]